MIFGKKGKPEELPETQMMKEQQLRDEETAMLEGGPPRINEEWGIGEKLITVSQESKISDTIELVAVVNKKGNITGWKTKRVESGYLELCNDDVASGFYNHNDLTVMRTGASLCASIKELAESLHLPVVVDEKIIGYQNIDMTPAYNMVAGEHNHIAVSSKGLEGQAAAMSRSHLAITRSTGIITRREDKGGSFPIKIKG